jgi:hypothetical protein
MSTATIQVWDCEHCSQIYRSNVALHWAPTHHCPSPRARLVRDFRLRTVASNNPTAKKERTS